MVVGEHGIQTFKVVVVVLVSFDVYIPTRAHPLLYLDKCLFKYTKMSIKLHVSIVSSPSKWMK